jgi:small subunit ribosomal protein S19e
MASMFDVSQQELTDALAQQLKKIPDFRPPEWAAFVKTGRSKQRAPLKDDWWYMRAASIMRILYKQGPIGVSKLRTHYGSKKNRGVKPERFYKASGNIVRKLLQQLEKAEFAKQVEKGVHKGRSLTPKGKSLVDKTAQALQKPAQKRPAPKPEAKPAKKDTKAGKAEQKPGKAGQPKSAKEARPQVENKQDTKTDNKPVKQNKPAPKEEEEQAKPAEKDGQPGADKAKEA